jgi:hypothetical protein
MPKQLITEIVGNADKFGAATKEAATHAETLNQKLSGFGKGMVLGAGVAAFGLVTGAIDTVVSKVGEADAAFRDSQVSTAQLTASLKANVPGWQAQADAVAKATDFGVKYGFSADSVRASLALLVVGTHNVTDASKLQATAMDLARLKNIDLATSTAILIKAHEGNLGALKRIGITIPPVTAAVDALHASHQKITPAELANAKAKDKLATATLAVATLTKIATGQNDAYAATTTGKEAAANERVHESMVKVGEIIDKVTSVVMPMLADAFSTAVDTIMSVWPQIEPAVKEAMDTVGQAIAFVTKNILPPLGAAIGWIVKNVVPPLQTVLHTLVTVYLAVLGKEIEILTKNVFPAIGAAIGWVTKNVIPPLAKEFDRFAQVVMPPVRIVLDALTKTVFPAIGQAVGLLTNTILPKLGAAFGGVANVVGKVFSTIVSTVKGVINTVVDIVNTVIRAIDAVQVHIHVGPVDMDWNGAGISQLPRMHSGGIVPGVAGTEQLIVAMAGERVTPSGVGRGAGGNTYHFHFHDGVYADGASLDRLANAVARRLRAFPST